MRLRCRRVLLGLLLLAGVSGLRGQSNLKVAGTVIDARTQAPLAGANVVVLGTQSGAATDSRGRFFIRDLPPGRYQLEVRMMGYRSLVVDVDVKLDVTAEVRAALEPQPLLFPGVVVTAPRPSSIPPSAAVTVITRQEIEERQAETIADLLEDVAGVQILATGGTGRPARLSLRGSATNQVLVLLDGQRLNTAQSGTVDLRTIPINWVERIEIIKGGSTALYGGDGIGGVVNIVTRNAVRDGKRELHVESAVGSFGARILSPSVRTALGPVGVHASYQRLHSSGDFPYQTFADPPKNSVLVHRVRTNAWTTSDNVFLKLSWQGKRVYRAELSGQHYDARMGIPGPENQLTPQARQVDRRTLLGALAGVSLGRSVFAKIQAYHHRFFQEYEAPPPGTYLFRNRHRNRATGAELRLYSQIHGAPLTVGYALRHDLLDSRDLIRPTRSLGRRSRSTHSLFAQAGIDLLKQTARPGLRLQLIPGYRIDRPSDNPTALSPKLGVVLTRGIDWVVTIKGNVGKSYRAPTLNSLFWVPDAFALGNPHLRPERATNSDIGMALRLPLLGDFQTEVTWFESDVQDIIIWQRQFDGRFRPFNVTRARIRGREDHLRWHLGRGALLFELNHTFLDARNRSGDRVTDGKQLVFRPRHTTSIVLAAQPGPFEAELRRRWVSKRYIREANTKSLAPYAVTDIRASFTLRFTNWKVKLGGRIDNVTDENYRLIEGYPMPGREWRIVIELDYDR